MRASWILAAAVATATGCVSDAEVGSVGAPAIEAVHVMGRVDGQAVPQLAFGTGAAPVTDALAVRDQRITVVMNRDLAGVYRFDDDAVRIVCDGEVMPYITEGREQNDWDRENLTLRLVPRYLRTNAVCSLEFAEFVTDGNGDWICAPADGDPDAGCRAGDTTAIAFHVEPFSLAFASPADTATGVPAGDQSVLLQFHPMAVESDTNLANVRIADSAGPVSHATRVTFIGDTQTIVVDVDGGLRPSTDYTVAIDGRDSGLTDVTGGVLEPAELTVSFRTAP